MSDSIPRREALRRLVVLSAAAAVPAWLVGCKSSPTCTDVSGLSPDDVTMRNQTAAYVDKSPDPSKKCSACSLYKPAGPDACGTCTAVKGPINPEGSCKLFVAKPA